MAQNHGPAALTGTVSSPEEGKMEGVVVSAKRPARPSWFRSAPTRKGSTAFRRTGSPPALTTSPSVPSATRSSRRRRRYNRAAPRNSTFSSRRPRRTFSPFKCPTASGCKARRARPRQKMALLRCLDCHGLQRPFFSKDNASDMAFTVQRMGAHSANASPNFPFFHQNASEILSRPPTKGQADSAAYIASINLSSGETWPYQAEDAAPADRQIDPGHHHDL